ncbi:MAG: hypothetical protein PVG72_02215 [Gammaproteobacteria bacterium]|jgi:hypothetical protein
MAIRRQAAGSPEIAVTPVFAMPYAAGGMPTGYMRMPRLHVEAVSKFLDDACARAPAGSLPAAVMPVSAAVI